MPTSLPPPWPKKWQGRASLGTMNAMKRCMGNALGLSEHERVPTFDWALEAEAVGTIEPRSFLRKPACPRLYCPGDTGVPATMHRRSILRRICRNRSPVVAEQTALAPSLCRLAGPIGGGAGQAQRGAAPCCDFPATLERDGRSKTDGQTLKQRILLGGSRSTP